MSKDLRFKLLVVDHDDTAVDSTRSIHYPAYLEIMSKMRPNDIPLSIDEFFLKNHTTGLMSHYINELGFTSDEVEQEISIWRSYTQTRVPDFYDGFVDILRDYRAAGGIIAVASLSQQDIIRSHYSEVDFIPDRIYGWQPDKSRCKPSRLIMEELMSDYSLAHSREMIVLDDSIVGINMAKSVGSVSIGALWAHREELLGSKYTGLHTIESDLKKMADMCIYDVSSLEGFLYK